MPQPGHSISKKYLKRHIECPFSKKLVGIINNNIGILIKITSSRIVKILLFTIF